MAHFPDLSPYSYLESGVRPGTLNVGWIDATHPYPKGPVPEVFLKRLWQYCKVPVVQTRGFHVCDFCEILRDSIPRLDFEGETLYFGSAEIRIIGANGVIYAAPTLIFHYVRDHEYQPPQAFIDASLGEPAPGTADYRAQLRALSFLK
jgi:hypothetical protein